MGTYETENAGNCDSEKHVFIRSAVHSARPIARSRDCAMKTIMEIKYQRIIEHTRHNKATVNNALRKVKLYR